jgi:tripartite-type tricarboxylate transporter receptor subunit TctC
MTLGSFRFLMLCCMALVCWTGMVSEIQAQQQYPVRPIRMIVPSAPGGGTDITARIIAPKLSEYLGQQVIVENRAGAGPMIGSETVAHATPDGYTLLMGISTLAINPAIYKKVPYDALTDFAPISLVVTLPNVLVVHPSLGVKSVKELITYSKARPGKINFASAGLGTSPHLSMELFLSMTGLKMFHVAYKGSGQGLIEVVGGHVPVMMPSMLSGTPHIKSGQLIALGVTSSTRTIGEPDIPTIAEAGVPGYEAVQWFGALAPKGTPREIVAKVHGAIVRALKDPDIRKHLVSDGADPIGSSPEEFSAYIRSETEKWVSVVRNTGIEKQ